MERIPQQPGSEAEKRKEEVAPRAFFDKSVAQAAGWQESAPGSGIMVQVERAKKKKLPWPWHRDSQKK